MSLKRLLSLVAVALVFLLATSAAADDFPFLKLNTPAQCLTEGGSDVSLPAGRFIPESSWLDLEKEWTILEDDNTRLTAENKVLGESDSMSSWKFGTAGVVLGIVIGVYVLDR